MIKIPAKTQERLVAGIKRFQPVVQKAKDKDINESDTVTIIADMLQDIFGFDKYTEITSEYAIKKTFCDLAIEIDGKVSLLLEAKAAGLALKDDYVRQAVDYGANAGIDWVVLTNAVTWKIFKITFSKPVEKELIYEFDFCELNPKRTEDLEMLFYLCRESIARNSNNLLYELAQQKKVLNHFMVGQLCITEPVLNVIKKELKKIAPDIKASTDDIRAIMLANVLKRDVFEGEKSDDARKRIQKYQRAIQKQQAESVGNSD